MKLAYKKEIEKRLRDRGFKVDVYTDWLHANSRISIKCARKYGSFLLVFRFWPHMKNKCKSDNILEAEIRIDDNCSWLISKKQIELTNEVIEKQGYAWIDETIQVLYEDAYKALLAKAKIAAEAAVTGTESIA